MSFWVKSLLLGFVFLVAACSAPGHKAVTLPDDIAKTTEGFVSALQRGDTASARKFVASASQEKFDLDFASDDVDSIRPSKQLKPLNIRRVPAAFSNPFENEVTVLYAAENKGEWTVFEVELYWLDEEKVEIDDWRFETKQEMPVILSQQTMVFNFMRYGMLAIAAIGAFFLLILIWFIRRKPNVVAPEITADERASAFTTRDVDTE
ncbi:MAG: hypothetical protein V3V15_05355 [Sphingorhabdus sp.]